MSRYIQQPPKFDIFQGIGCKAVIFKIDRACVNKMDLTKLYLFRDTSMHDKILRKFTNQFQVRPIAMTHASDLETDIRMVVKEDFNQTRVDNSHIYGGFYSPLQINHDIENGTGSSTAKTHYLAAIVNLPNNMGTLYCGFKVYNGECEINFISRPDDMSNNMKLRKIADTTIVKARSEVFGVVEDVKEGVEDVKEGVEDVKEGVEDVKEGVEDVEEGVEDVKEGVVREDISYKYIRVLYMNGYAVTINRCGIISEIYDMSHLD
jgi:hypothetical protein